MEAEAIKGALHHMALQLGEDSVLNSVLSSYVFQLTDVLQMLEQALTSFGVCVCSF